jgi:hypothetical protein
MSGKAEDNTWMLIDPGIHFEPTGERRYMTINRCLVAYPQNTPFPEFAPLNGRENHVASPKTTWPQVLDTGMQFFNCLIQEGAVSCL